MTGLDYVKAVLELIGVYAPGESVSDGDSNSTLNTLNRMLDTWSADLDGVFSETVETFAVTSSDESYTIGPTGDFVTSRPIEILRAKLRDAQGIDHDMRQMPFAEYEDIILKEPGDSLSKVFAYNPTNPDGTILIWPPPDTNYSLRITSRKALASMTLAAEYAVPPGYQDAIVWAGAVLAAPVYGRIGYVGSPMDKGSIAGIAHSKFRGIITANMSIQGVNIDPAIPFAEDGYIRDWRYDN
jgi:hypothetical protein